MATVVDLHRLAGADLRFHGSHASAPFARHRDRTGAGDQRALADAARSRRRLPNQPIAKPASSPTTPHPTPTQTTLRSIASSTGLSRKLAPICTARIFH